MDDFSSKISELLKNPESLEKIKLIAESLSSDTDTQQAFSDNDENDSSVSAVQDNSDNNQSIFSSIDPQLLMKLGSILSYTDTKNDKNINLMNSIKPYLSEKRATKMDTALQMLKLGKYASAFLKDTDLFKKQDK